MSQVTDVSLQQSNANGEKESDAVGKTYEAITQVVWLRFRSFLIDSIIYSLILGGLASMLGISQASQNGFDWFPAWTFVQLPWFQGAHISISWSYLILFLYYFIQEWLFGTTIGKRVMGLYVVNINGARMKWWQVLIRNVVRPIDYGFFFIGFFLVRFDRFHQRLGDRWASTLVVNESSLLALPVGRDETRRGLRILALSAIPLIVCCFAFIYYLSPPLFIAGLFANHQSVFLETLAPPQPGNGNVQQTSTCITGYTLGTATKSMQQGTEAITYPITYEIYNGSRPNQTGSIMLLWHGFFDGGWTVNFGTGPNCSQ